MEVFPLTWLYTSSSIQNRSLFLKTEISQKAFSMPSSDANSATLKNRLFSSVFPANTKSLVRLAAKSSVFLGALGLVLSPFCQGVDATKTFMKSENNTVVIADANDAKFQGTDAGLIAPQRVTQRVSLNQSTAPRYTSSSPAVNGVMLNVPAPRTYTVPAAQRVATGSSYGGETTASLIWPSKGTLSSSYGRRWGRMHQGIDIAGPIGTPIVAAADGVVVTSEFQSGGYGNLIELQHNDGSITRYAHNNRLHAGVGQTVKQGQHISDMGNTGRSTGPHLHFEFHPGGGSAVNPMAYLPR
jgi:murein DD-endopeptidase MepM/ murein hydrolase activator NlpD